jgi:hypothetical protein
MGTLVATAPAGTASVMPAPEGATWPPAAVTVWAEKTQPALKIA